MGTDGFAISTGERDELHARRRRLRTAANRARHRGRPSAILGLFGVSGRATNVRSGVSVSHASMAYLVAGVARALCRRVRRRNPRARFPCLRRHTAPRVDPQLVHLGDENETQFYWKGIASAPRPAVSRLAARWITRRIAPRTSRDIHVQNRWRSQAGRPEASPRPPDTLCDAHALGRCSGV